jgi:hypothetical protein
MNSLYNIIKTSVILSLSLNCIVFAQTFDFVKSAVDTTVSFKEDEQYEMYAGIKNLSNTTVTIAYKVKKNKVPSGWRYSLCDPEKCNVPGTAASDSGKAVLQANSTTQLFRVTVYPTTVDNLDVEYEVYDISNASNKKTATFTFSNEPFNTVTLGNSNITLSGVGNKQSISINSTVTWTLLGIPTWLEVNSISGTGRGIITFTNKQASNDIAVITVSGSNPLKTISVRQSATTSIREGGKLNILTVYPNPAYKGDILRFSHKTNYSLFDILGNNISNETQADFLNTSNLAEGIYLLKIDTLVKKIIIK